MLQLFGIGIILYIILFLLAKSNIYNGMSRLLSVVNTAIIVILIVIVLIKTGLIRVIATFISLLFIRLSEIMSSLF